MTLQKFLCFPDNTVIYWIYCASSVNDRIREWLELGEMLEDLLVPASLCCGKGHLPLDQGA